MVVGVINRTSNIDSQLSELLAYLNTSILELAKGVQIMEDGLYSTMIFFNCIVIRGYSLISDYMATLLTLPLPHQNRLITCLVYMYAVENTEKGACCSLLAKESDSH